MVIFHSYVSLPEGMGLVNHVFMGNSISEIGEIPGKSTMVSGCGVSYERVKGLIQLK